jgi:2-polyprenyl-6-methoxyphenol hydroxylase-like FAD-dependent oxidoreductase
MVYDVIVVGARCAGAPLAMLLARRGHSVLLLERVRMPCDTASTHWIRWPGVQWLDRWGLLGRLISTGCPPIHRVFLDFDFQVLAGAPASSDGVAATYAPRRTVLDGLLVDAACEAGAELWENFAVRDVVWEDGVVCGVRGVTTDGREIIVRRRLVVGADGRNSTIARAVGAPILEDRGILARSTYGYWSSSSSEGIRVYFRGRHGISLWPTNGELTVVSLVFPRDEHRTVGRDGMAEHYLRSLAQVPEVAEAMRPATLEGPVRTAAVRNSRRRAHGPGWALAGDAGHHKDPVSAQGISDAFADAAALADAVHLALIGEIPMEKAVSWYESSRDEDRLAAFQYTCDQAELRPFGDDFSRELDKVKADPQSIEDFLSTFVGSKDPPGDTSSGTRWLGESH